MYRRFRLSTHRKNEFRKCRRLKQEQMVQTETVRMEQACHEHEPLSLVLSVPLDVVSVMKISLDREFYLQIPLQSLDTLQCKISEVSLPQGKPFGLHCMCTY